MLLIYMFSLLEVQRPILMFNGEVIPSDGSGSILITEVGKNTKPLSCRLNVGQGATFIGWYEHPTSLVFGYPYNVPDSGSTSSSGWSQMKSTNSLDLYKLRSNATEGVFSCFIGNFYSGSGSVGYLGIYLLPQ